VTRSGGISRAWLAGPATGYREGMVERIDRGAHQIAWAGTRVGTGDAIPGAGAWELVDHQGCEGEGRLQAMAGGATAPRCPVCGADVRWQLTHLAPTVAADHRDVGRLP
jgi:hypothetical protein